MKYHFKTKKEKTGYWAFCLELEGCQSQGDSLKELKANCAEALNLYLAEPETSRTIFPLPKKGIKSSKIFEVEVDPTVALAMLVRQTRLKNGKTQKEIAEALNIHLSAYQKYEDHQTSNLELKTIQKLKRVLPNLNVSIIFE
jgi:antitoxin HicB